MLASVIAEPLEKEEMLIFAVTPEGKGTTATLELEISDGSGEVWSRIESLVGISTQNTQKTVVTLAKSYSQDVSDYDYKFSIKSDAQIVDGPSAGLPMGLLTISMVQGKHLPSYVSATGTISTQGTIGKVGGILEKTREASTQGIKLFLIPKSEIEAVVKDGEVKKVNLSEYAYKEWGIKVVGVDTLDDALNYAFMDIDDIDINIQDSEERIIYNPPGVNTSDELKQLYNFTVQYRNETKINLDNAMSALNKTTLEDNDVLNYLYETLTLSQNSYDDGNIALDKNYLYSAANYLFLSNIYANFVYDIARNPAMLESSTQLINNIKELKDEINEYKSDLNEVPYSGLEWDIAAKERLLWAEKYIEDISTVNVIINGTDVDTKSLNLGKLEKYEFSKEWIRISRTFHNYARDKQKVIDDTPYKKSAEEIIAELDKAEDIIASYSIQDIDRRIYGAKTAYARGWYLVSIYESASALAIINSTIETNEKDYFEIKTKTKEQSDELSETLDEKSYIWATLYLDHSKYFYSAAEFYEEENKMVDALDNIKSSYQLLTIAKNLAETMSDVEANKNTIIKTGSNSTSSSSDGITAQVTIDKEGFDSALFKKVLIVLLLALALAIVVIIILYKKFKHSSVYDTAIGFNNYQIYKTKEMIIDLDKKFLDGKVDENTYKSLTDKYRQELKELEIKKTKLLEIMTDIESQESELKYLQNKLDTTNSLFKKGLIGEKEYKSRSSLYKKEIGDLTQGIKSDEDKMISTIERGKRSNNTQGPIAIKEPEKKTKNVPKKQVKAKKFAAKKDVRL